MKAIRRTFEAAKHPQGSMERLRLNQSWITSEYMPSYRWGVVEDDGTTTAWTYRTKAEAEARAAGK